MAAHVKASMKTNSFLQLVCSRTHILAVDPETDLTPIISRNEHDIIGPITKSYTAAKKEQTSSDPNWRLTPDVKDDRRERRSARMDTSNDISSYRKVFERNQSRNKEETAT